MTTLHMRPPMLVRPRKTVAGAFLFLALAVTSPAVAPAAQGDFTRNDSFDFRGAVQTLTVTGTDPDHFFCKISSGGADFGRFNLRIRTGDQLVYDWFVNE